MRTAHLFISYSRTDSELALELAEQLIEKTREVWIDRNALPPAQPWQPEVDLAIDACEGFIFIISPASISSVHCRRELARAEDAHKRVIPVVAHPINPADAPPSITKPNWIPTHDANRGRMAERVVQAQDYDAAHVRMHTGLYRRALEWSDNDRNAALLLRGDALETAEEWLLHARAKQPAPTTLHSDYVVASAVARGRRQRWTIVALVSITATIALLAIFALVSRQDAVESSRRALASALSAQSRLALLSRRDLPERSALLAMESLEREASVEGYEALRTALRILPRRAGTIEHGDIVTQVAISGDGLRGASASWDGVVRVWAIPDGQLLFEADHPVVVWDLALTEHGDRLITGAADASVIVWDVRAGRELTRIVHVGEVFSVELSADESRVLSADSEGAQISDLETGHLIARVSHGTVVRAVAFSPDGWSAVSAGREGVGLVWDPWSGIERLRLAHDGIVLSASYSSNGAWILTSGTDGWIRIWDAYTGGEHRRFEHAPGILRARFSPDERTVAGAGEDGLAALWDANSGEQVAGFKHQGRINHVAFSPDGTRLVVTSLDSTATEYATDTFEEKLRVVHRGGVGPVAITPNGHWLVTGGWDHRVQISDARKDLEHVRAAAQGSVWSLAISDSGDVVYRAGEAGVHAIEISSGKSRALNEGVSFFELELSPDGRYLAAISMSGVLKIWDAVTLELRASREGLGALATLAFSPDGSLLATGSNNGTTLIRRVPSLEEHRNVSGAWRGRDLSWSSDGSLLATSGEGAAVVAIRVDDGKIVHREPEIEAFPLVAFSPVDRVLIGIGTDGVHVWSIDTWSELASPSIGAAVDSAMFSPDGRYLAIAAHDESVRVFDTRDWREKAKLKHDDDVGVLAFDRRSRFLATGNGVQQDESAANEVRVWDLATGREVARMKHTSEVLSLAFSPDGRELAAGTRDEVLVSQWQAGELIKEACARVGRDLDEDEWRTFVGDEERLEICERPVPMVR